MMTREERNFLRNEFTRQYLIHRHIDIIVKGILLQTRQHITKRVTAIRKFPANFVRNLRKYQAETCI